MSELIELSTADLVGTALDWAVARATEADDLRITAAGSICCIYELPCGSGCWTEYYQPSSDWAVGGPLIEKYKVLLTPPTDMVHRNFGNFDSRNGWYESGMWGSTIFGKDRKHRRTAFHHPDSPLIAAMRAIVQFELGDTVQVPKTLLP